MVAISSMLIWITDENDILYPHASNQVRFEVYGPGKIIEWTMVILIVMSPMYRTRYALEEDTCCY